MSEPKNQAGQANTAEKIPEAGNLENLINDLQGQMTFLRQQILYTTDRMGSQVQSQIESNQALQLELKKFQTGAPQRAMASVFTKFIRDLLSVMNSLDELCAISIDTLSDDVSISWLKSIYALREKYEAILFDWGCVPIEIKIFEDLFDPEIHEAVNSQINNVPENVPEDSIIGITRRGWRFHGSIIQYPQVVVK